MCARSTSYRRSTRLLVGYVALIGTALAIIFVAMAKGSDKIPVREIGGPYTITPASGCVGSKILLTQSGRFVELSAPTEAADDSGIASDLSGRLQLEGDRLSGDVACRNTTAVMNATIEGAVLRCAECDEDNADVIVRGPTLSGLIAGREFGGSYDVLAANRPAAAEMVTRSPEETFWRLMLAMAVVLLAARFVGAAVARIGQPRVMGEVIAGILLGPTLLGAFAPELQRNLFPPDIIPLLIAGADIGLVFYMFLVGLELDPRSLRGRAEQAAFISHGSIAVPMALGIAIAVPLFGLVGPSVKFPPFALFMGVSMSITAFPVLARILIERHMLKGFVGSMAIAAAAVDDVSAWVLLALATGVAEASTGSGGSTLATLARVVLLSILFCLAMGLIVRRLLARVSDAYDEAGHVPTGWIAAIFVGVLLSAVLAGQIPITPIFGAFVMGLIMPRRADLTHDVTRRLEDFVVTVLLPLFFVVTGLRTDIGALNSPLLWGLTLALLAVAVLSKWAGAMGAARFTGIPLRSSAAIGALMNTRGLTELIVLTIGLSHHVITPALFTMLVLMALATTFMTGPALRLIDPNGEMSVPPEEELERAAPVPERPIRSILVAPQEARGLDALLSIAEPLALSEPPRELILARLLVPDRVATGVASEERELDESNAALQARRHGLMEQGIAARAVAFVSPDAGADIVRLASDEGVDLVLLDGRRPLLGEGVPRGAVGEVLADAVPDVAVFVGKHGVVPEPDRARPVIVAFGGAEHDWAALELGAWIATARDAKLILLGAESDPRSGERDASRLLASASLVIQQLVGISAEPRLAQRGREGILDAAGDAGLLVLGLSDRWRREGLGEVRAAIARSAPAPTVFVRRGRRSGVLAPRGEVTRFTWSRTSPRSPSDHAAD